MVSSGLFHMVGAFLHHIGWFHTYIDIDFVMLFFLVELLYISMNTQFSLVYCSFALHQLQPKAVICWSVHNIKIKCTIKITHIITYEILKNINKNKNKNISVQRKMKIYKPRYYCIYSNTMFWTSDTMFVNVLLFLKNREFYELYALYKHFLLLLLLLSSNYSLVKQYPPYCNSKVGGSILIKIKIHSLNNILTGSWWILSHPTSLRILLSTRSAFSFLDWSSGWRGK